MSSEEESKYQTPPTCDLLSLLLKNRRPTGAVNEVWPNLFIGDAASAQDKTLLSNLEITHVVNAADGRGHIDTGPCFYKDTNIMYHGIEAPDCRDFDLSPFFTETADFIHTALSGKGKVLVHCARGISRSATFVLAFLMIKERLTVVEAVKGQVFGQQTSDRCPSLNLEAKLCFAMHWTGPLSRVYPNFNPTTARIGSSNHVTLKRIRWA